MNKKIFLVKQITPPFMWLIVKKVIDFTNRNKNIQNNVSWHKITAGPLTGHKMFGDKESDWFKNMLDGQYDKKLFDYLASINLLGRTVVEVGAHVGYHAMIFAKQVGPNGQVFAFEPNIHNIDRLKKNLNENKDIGNRIEVMNIALSDKPGIENFVFGDRVDKGSSSGSFLDRSDTVWEKSVYESKKIGFKRMSVNTQTIDNLRSEGVISKPIALCKIDVEGGENLVLLGAIKTLRTDRPIILIEVHSIFNMWKIAEIFNREKYKLDLMHKELDGRVFFIAHP